MKYAFILGSNAYISSRGSISFFENTQDNEFLKIQSVFKPVKAGNSELSVELHIKDLNDTSIELPQLGIHIDESPERLKISNPDGSVLIDVHQLEEADYMHLSHHITAELERYSPIAVIRVFGHFKVGSHRIIIDNEKLFIDDESFAESVLVGNGGVQLRAHGVLL